VLTSHDTHPARGAAPGARLSALACPVRRAPLGGAEAARPRPAPAAHEVDHARLGALSRPQPRTAGVHERAEVEAEAWTPRTVGSVAASQQKMVVGIHAVKVAADRASAARAHARHEAAERARRAREEARLGLGRIVLYTRLTKVISVPLFLNRQCHRTIDAAAAAGGDGGAGGAGRGAPSSA
jgi:hypothetical protein